MPDQDDRPKIRRCHKCDALFVSPDPSRVAKCADCREETDTYEPRCVANTQQIRAAMRQHHHKDTS